MALGYETIREIEEEMITAANNLEFEKADDIKRKLESLKDYISDSTIVNPGLGNFHVFGFTEDDLLPDTFESENTDPKGLLSAPVKNKKNLNPGKPTSIIYMYLKEPS